MSVYSLHGVAVASALPLPALAASAQTAVALSLERLDPGEPIRLEGGEVFASSDTPGASYAAARGAFGVSCRYGALGGVHFDTRARALVEVHDADVETAQALFCGSALAIWLVARSELVLHASAVTWDACSVAIVGASCAGKTTLAAQCVLAGARLLGDDVLRVTLDGDSVLWHAGVRWLRLRSGSAALRDAWPGASYRSGRDGRWVVTPALDEAPAIGRLDAVLFPRLDPSAQRLTLRPITAAAALGRLVLTPRVRGLKAHDLLRAQLQRGAALARAVPSFEVTLPLGPPFVEASGLALRTELERQLSAR